MRLSNTSAQEPGVPRMAEGEVDGPGCTDDAVIAEVGVGGWPHAPVLTPASQVARTL